MSEPELCKVLESSVYPGAELGSIKLVIAVCRAAHLDPLQKPYHIVPMDVKVKLPNGKFEYVKRDVVMPGIGLYRTQAARTGEYAGISEPEFGPMLDMKWKESYQETEDGPTLTREITFQYPEWCRMTVRRLVQGHVVEFTAKEYWIENYATKGKNSTRPNAMWTKRPRGQIAKCAEAQALRKAFPEIGAQPTAEEMEGKTVEQGEDGALIDGKTGKVIPPLMAGTASAPAAPSGQAPSQVDTAGDATGRSGAATDAVVDDKPMSDGERAHIKKKLEGAALSEIDLKAKFGVDLAGLTASQFKPVKAWIANPTGQ